MEASHITQNCSNSLEIPCCKGAQTLSKLPDAASSQAWRDALTSYRFNLFLSLLFTFMPLLFLVPLSF